jgi:NADPH:quinone reductase-like Zn-dependent oxidoreductase
MRAFVLRSFGSADRLRLEEVDTPEPADGEALVRVRGTSVNPYDWHHMRGEPVVARLMPGGPPLRRPVAGVLGCDVAGRVESVGRGVTRVRPGDDVYALIPHGAYAEYVRVPQDLLAPKPAGLSYEQAAAVPMAAVTALVAVRDQGRVRPGQRVLVNGASGGVGTFAVQLARAFGATVDAICGARNADLVSSLGATDVYDRRGSRLPVGRRYDVVVDVAGGRPLSAYRAIMARKGTFVLVGGPAGRWLQPAGHMFSTLARGPLVSQRVVLADTVRLAAKREALAALTELIDRGAVAPVVGRRFPFEELPEAVRYQEEGHATGKVVVSLDA